MAVLYCNEVSVSIQFNSRLKQELNGGVYNGRGDALACGSYMGVKPLKHAMKVLERVIEGRVRQIVRIDSLQFGFMAGRSTTDAIFIGLIIFIYIVSNWIYLFCVDSESTQILYYCIYWFCVDLMSTQIVYNFIY